MSSIKIQVDLQDEMPDYGMFTDLGNAAVHAVVVAARENAMTWAQVIRALRALADQEPFGEAMDTAVREVVYDALGFYAKGEEFYGA